jgi:flavin reductase (DIM6/NTAB) family NADH-FMN oxidoreductase RutF
MTDASAAQLPVTANFINPPTLHHPAGCTHVVEVTAGRPVSIAGQVALDPTGALVGPGDIGAQARQVFDNLQAAVQAVGAGLERVAGSGGEPGDKAETASGPDPIRVGGQPPFAVPPERRSPARRLRGRLVAPVTVWTAGRPPGGAGLTVSSVLIAEGQPARLLGLIDPTSALWETAQETQAFVVHVLGAGDRALAERFSEVRPPIRSPFERLEVAESPWGPVLDGARPRAACRLAGSTPVGYAELVEGVIEQLELPDLHDPLAYLQGGYRSVRELPDRG